MNDLRVCVEISTFNNKEVLQMVLQRLAQQSYPASLFKVVISDDGSSDGLLDMVESMRDDLPYAITVLKHNHQGAAAAHNQGIRACDGDIVLMLAADILATPDLISEHVNTHRQHPDKHVMVAGRLVQSKELPQTVFQQGWDRLVNELFAKERKELKHGGFFVSNLSFNKDFMLQHGMFRNWPPAAQEDIELGYRLLHNGMQLVTNPAALGFHHHQATLSSVSRRAYLEGYNWHHFEAEVPELWVRAKTGHVALTDGVGVVVRTLAKKLIRSLVLNRITVPYAVIPMIKAAEKAQILAPLVPLLAGKVAAYYFCKGQRDFESNTPSGLDEIHI
jgi:glycosyltransferase involved in cell wall biosynthesis